MGSERPDYLPDGVHDDPENRAFWKERAENKAKVRKLAVLTLIVCAAAWAFQHFA